MDEEITRKTGHLPRDDDRQRSTHDAVPGGASSQASAPCGGGWPGDTAQKQKAQSSGCYPGWL